MLDMCFDKVARDGISPQQQKSGSNKKTHERQHSWDGKVRGVCSKTPTNATDKAKSYNSVNSFNKIQ